MFLKQSSYGLKCMFNVVIAIVTITNHKKGDKMLRVYFIYIVSVWCAYITLYTTLFSRFQKFLVYRGRCSTSVLLYLGLFLVFGKLLKTIRQKLFRMHDNPKPFWIGYRTLQHIWQEGGVYALSKEGAQYMLYL